MTKLLLLITICFMACGPQEPRPDQLADAPTKLKYFKDTNTQLCFALLGSYVSGYNSFSIANVPCNMVEKQLLPR